MDDQKPLIERITINLTRHTAKDLDDIVERESTNKTDAVNKAVKVYAYLLSILQDEDAKIIVKYNNGTQERIKFL